jgi:hypothetical protein
MNNPKADAIRDMGDEGIDTSHLCSLDVEDIVDPIVEFGFEPTARDFIDMTKRRCDALGALVLGVNREKEFPARHSKNLLKALAADYCVTEKFLLGVEAGFAQRPQTLSLPWNVGSKEFRKGYMIGYKAWENLMNPPLQPGANYMA